MRSWMENRIVALLDTLLGAAVLAGASALLPVSFVVQAIVLAALLLCLWILVHGRTALRAATLSRPLPTTLPAASGRFDRIESDPRATGWDPVPPPPPRPRPKGNVVVSPLSIWELEDLPSGDPASRPPLSQLERNDPCWCGSGKKYKKCHGA